ncbi:sigma-70 family RNA polymerase sigma factor [Fulvivirga sp. M361]|uniref:RNA polymerase sigma factor n=1 Tax=Fulvivirga sp. M361 TaxID=2594266 RepID=UPI00117BA7ED|nr:sigma-70 family RNA polymerase sigma factor [Fulvivirga sp. M361]TRX60770.1 sigma-70 family RNA polymerase sigma factor [Fulvivirga sp. M361]
MIVNNNEELSDPALIARMKKGNRLAFKIIYDRYWDNLFQAAYKLLKDEDAAQDVIQEVFFDLWNRIEQLEIENLAGFLFKAARFQALKQLRNIRLLDIHESRYQELIGNNNVEEQLDLNELQRTIENSLGQLPAKYKVVFELSRIDNLTNKEIANRLNLSPRTVEWYLHTTLKHLKSSLTPSGMISLNLMGCGWLLMNHYPG